MRYIIGIDPGCSETAFCSVDQDLRPIWFEKRLNELGYCDLVEHLMTITPPDRVEIVIENVESFGMPVGREIFDTLIWIGMLHQRLKAYPITLITRHMEKLTICHSPKANDATIKRALVDRFAPDDKNYGKGTKAAPGWFYGFSADVWSAYAIAVTYDDMLHSGFHRKGGPMYATLERRGSDG